MTTRSSSLTRHWSGPWMLLLLLWTTAGLCQAFAPSLGALRSRSIHGGRQQQQQSLYQSSFSQEQPPASSTTSTSPSAEALRHDIEAMRREAQRRLDALTTDLHEFQTAKESIQQLNEKSTADSSSEEEEEGTTVVPAPTTTTTTTSLEEEEVLSSTATTSFRMPDATTNKLSDSDRAMEQIISKESPTTTTTVVFNPPVNVHLLENTRWKIVFNLGREPGTWMAPAWGASGDRLRFTVEVDLLDAPLPHGERVEDFLEGMAGAKQLRVREAWIQSTFDENYHGRRNLRVASSGGYKVVRGAGPLGTDVFRFYIEAEEAFRASAASDVYAPRGRIYGNCGYFPTLEPELRDSYHAYKDRLQKEYRATAVKYEQLQQENEEDLRLISWERVSRIKDEVTLRKRLQELDSKIQEARQREPERAQLRLSRKGDVGLTRDGGVCCKVQKGLALEYHILGRMEIAAVEKDHGDIHEDYKDLVNKLHP